MSVLIKTIKIINVQLNIHHHSLSVNFVKIPFVRSVRSLVDGVDQLFAKIVPTLQKEKSLTILIQIFSVALIVQSNVKYVIKSIQKLLILSNVKNAKSKCAKIANNSVKIAIVRYNVLIVCLSVKIVLQRCVKIVTKPALNAKKLFARIVNLKVVMNARLLSAQMIKIP